MRSWHKYIGIYVKLNDETLIMVEDFEGPTKIGQRQLPLHLEIYNHSPTGFSWGYQGSGPAQTALAICYDHILYQAGGDRQIARERALAIHQGFKSKVVAAWDKDENWVITTDAIERVITEIEHAAQPSSA
jgi:hypothetical protein